ncbi:MAG: MCE family protein [Solirubrobacteraceae bacterium]|nr:MCE family protein [Solirubrobacteraceae bacterium]
MKRALERYGVSFAAIVAVVVVGVVAASYILANQRFYLPNWVPVVGSDFVDYTVDFHSAKAVVPGQGQTVAISGVTVGEIGAVNLVNGRGRVTMKIRREYIDRLHTDASAALRPRTPLQDMVIQLDPGTKSAPKLKPGGNIPAARTMTPVELDEILSEFDVDTRAYLAILLQQGAKGLSGEGGKELGDVLRKFEPTTVYTARIAKAMKSRNAEAARAVTNLERVAAALGKNDEALGTFIANSSEAFTAIAERDQDLAGVLRKSPATLQKTRELLETTGKLSADLGRASRTLERPTRKFDAGLAQLTEFMNAATPVVRDDLRPFAQEVQAPLAKLKPAVDNVADSAKNVSTGGEVLRQLFDGLAYEPPNGDFSALTLAGYIGHAGMSLTSFQDAAGAVGRAVLYTDCAVSSLTNVIRQQNPAARSLIDLLGVPETTTVVSGGQTVAQVCASIPRSDGKIGGTP